MSLDVLAFGNAIVDVLCHTDNDFLVKHHIPKGSMQLIDEARAQALFEAMGPTHIVSGGSAANTAAGIASLGGKAGFVGKVRDDKTGQLFAHDIKAAGVAFETVPAQTGPATAQSFILVTPDGERTMNTYLGACQALSSQDINETQTASAKIIYLEGYLWDPQDAKEAFRKAISIAHKNGNKVAFTLSDSFCVDRYRDEFLHLIRSGDIDLLFANEHELKSLYTTSSEEEAVKALAQENILGVVTRSERGALVVTYDQIQAVPAFLIPELVDTTGAGDLFAAGFLAGITQGRDAKQAAQLGSFAASHIIQFLGARPKGSLKRMAEQEGF